MVAIPASLALCAVAAGLATTSPGRGVELRSAATIMGSAVAGWAAGLGGMWASKWVFAWLFVDRDQIVDSVRDQVEFRTGGDYEGVTGTRLTGFTKNVEYFLDQPLAPPVLLAIVAAIGIGRVGLAWPVDADWWTGLRDVALCMLARRRAVRAAGTSPSTTTTRSTSGTPTGRSPSPPGRWPRSHLQRCSGRHLVASLDGQRRRRGHHP